MIEINGHTRPMIGEIYNGDSIFIHRDDELSVFCVVDGIGHGKRAHQISQKACKYIDTIISSDPSDMIAKTHAFMKGSEGAAIGIGVIRANTLTFAGLGNISCFTRGKNPKRFVGMDGLLGVRGHSVKNETTILSPGDLVVMHSDGLSLKDFLHEPDTHHLFSANGLARKLIKKYGSFHDDASVIIVQLKK